MKIFNENAAAALFNMEIAIRGTSARISWNGTDFIVTDSSMPKRIASRKVPDLLWCNTCYMAGFRGRADFLAECYSLSSLDFKKGDVFLDCGANIGDIKLWFDIRSIDVEYIGFEPAPREFRCLKENVAPSVVHNVGLWNESGNMDFYVFSPKGDSSLIEPPKYDHVVSVKTKRLEEFITSRVKCLKLEAEGAEPEILEGIGDKLGMIEYIVVNVDFERGVAKESTRVPVMNYLTKNGFEFVEERRGGIFLLFKNRNF